MSQGANTPTSDKGRLTQRISAISQLVVNNFATDAISNYAGRVKNGVVERYANDQNRTYVTQRPGITIRKQASATVADTHGRGIHYWKSNGKTYFMNEDIIYKNDYATPCSVQGGDTAILVSGTERVYFLEWSSANADYLFIFDPEANNFYAISSLASTTVINIADRSGSGTLEGFAVGDAWDFDAINAIITTGLAHGAVQLDAYLFLGLTNSRIYNSNNDDWLNWEALGFLTCERENDDLLYIGKSKDQVVGFGDRTIEFYYDNANTAPASPLSARKDVTYRVGVAGPSSIWGEGDDIHFISTNPSGEFTMSTLSGMELKLHENRTYHAFLWMSRYTEDLQYIMSGSSVNGHTYVFLTAYNAGVVVNTIVYDYSMDAWYDWDCTAGSVDAFSMVDNSIREYTNEARPLSIMRNGDVFRFSDDFTPNDHMTVLDTDTYPEMIMITDNFDGGTTESKFMYSLNYVGNMSAASQTLTVEYSDDNGATWLSTSIDVNTRTQINRLGKFISRKFRFTTSATEQLRFEGFDVTFAQGSV